MKTVMSKQLTKVMCISLILLGLSPSVFAYPPDNAAVLYYQACLLYQSEEDVRQIVEDYGRGKVELTEEIIKHIEEYDQIIELAVDAADVQYCDWGLQYTKGLDIPFPGLSSLKRISLLILADARMLAEEDDYDLAMERCLTAYKMARHASDRSLIYWLVGIAIDVYADRCIQDILSEIPQDSETLTWLKNKLSVIDPFPPFKNCMDFEFGLAKPYMQMEKKEELISEIPEWIDNPESEEAKSLIEKLRDADEEYFYRARAYHRTVESNVISALDMPYPQAYARLVELGKKTGSDAESGISEAILTAILCPALGQAYTLGMRGKTHFNAIRTAVAIYNIMAQTGQLPDATPAGSPKDLFSGKDFEYEKTADGFILHCQGKDLVKDKTYEYEFKVE